MQETKMVTSTTLAVSQSQQAGNRKEPDTGFFSILHAASQHGCSNYICMSKPTVGGLVFDFLQIISDMIDNSFAFVQT